MENWKQRKTIEIIADPNTNRMPFGTLFQCIQIQIQIQIRIFYIHMHSVLMSTQKHVHILYPNQNWNLVVSSKSIVGSSYSSSLECQMIDNLWKSFRTLRMFVLVQSVVNVFNRSSNNQFMAWMWMNRNEVNIP